MSSYPTDDSVHPTTPLFDETVTSTAVYVPADDDVQTGGASGGAGQKKDAVKNTAGQAKDTAADAAGQAKDTVKDAAGQVAGEAKQVGATAADAGQRVASTTKDEASRVASDVASQARTLYHQATTELSSQAAKQQERAASGVRTISQDLSNMGTQHQGGGVASELVQNLSQRAERVADWLENRQPGELLDDVRQYAARRPGLFILLAGVTGAVAARATKALVAEAKPDVPKGLSTGTTGPEFTSTYTDAPAAYVDDVEIPATDDPYGNRTYGTSGSYGTGLGDVR
jgi:hypothetical protein